MQTIVVWFMWIRNTVDPILFISLLTTAYASMHVIVHDSGGLQSGLTLYLLQIVRDYVYFFAALTNPYTDANHVGLNWYS